MKKNNAVHLILQGKGGVGKSLVSSFLAQFFYDQNERVVTCFDTDPVNQTFTNYKSLKAIHLPLLENSKINERNFDALLERLLSDEGVFIVDNGSSSFVPLSNYIIENNVIAMLKDAGRDVYVHCVVTGGQALLDTLSGFKALAEQFNSKNVVVWLNEYFGAIELDGKKFTDMKAFTENADKVLGMVKIVKRNQDTFGADIEDMTARKLTFDEAIKSADFSLMAKQRVKIVQKDIFTQLAEVGF